MDYKVWEKGSQWRKWDLHVHTPASFHWKGGNLLRNMNSGEKELAFLELLRAIETSDVAVFCFMDYWTFDGYLQFTEFMKGNGISCTKTIFPGMELRIEAPVNYRLNIHVILSNLLTKQQLEDFKSKLTVRTLNRSLSDESIIEFAKTLDASKAKHNGFHDPNTLDTDELLRLGASTIEVTKESLNHAINSIPRGTGYVILPYDTSDGLLKLDWKAHPHADNYFMQSAHIFESRNEDVVQLFSGITTDKNKNIIENFQKTLNYVQKPVICGSDAHQYSDYGHFPGGKATWIKSDPTFEGLKQIIYEPRSRVQIQELQPHEKIPYLVIDKVRFVDNTNEKRFSPNWINLNENLNTIIGGKSSGKSLLLYHIAKTIAPNLVEGRKNEVEILDYDFGTLEDFDFEVVWQDGHVDRLSEPMESNVREIEYIPQLYVNSLAEKEGKKSLYNLIESILEQNADYRNFTQKIKLKIADLEIAIDDNVDELLRKRREYNKLLEERKEIGELKAINNEIRRLTSLIRELRKASNFTDEEEDNYNRLMILQAEERGKKTKYAELSKSIDSFTLTLEQLEKQFIQVLNRQNFDLGIDFLSRRVLNFLRLGALSKLRNTIGGLIASQKSLSEKARSKAEKCAVIEKSILEELKPYTSKVHDQTRLRKFEDDLKKQDEIKDKYLAKTKLIESVREEGRKTREEVFENYTALLNCYKNIIEKLQVEDYSKIDDDIALEAIIKFDNERFSASFGDLFDRRTTSFKSMFGIAFGENNDFRFDEAIHIQNITAIFEKLSTKSETTLKKGITQADAIVQLFKNYFKIEYNIQYRNDEILDMSPGKRGLVLLQLILHISNATHPILIDQPEDNLDNRTISNELRHFISNKKLSRQIIMVTHDANLVVLTDAENVIVSNQDGQQTNRENEEYRFEYVAGALENSFRLPNQDSGKGVLYSSGIREHVCDVLEGGELAFKKREEKYGFSQR